MLKGKFIAINAYTKNKKDLKSIVSLYNFSNEKKDKLNLKPAERGK